MTLPEFPYTAWINVLLLFGMIAIGSYVFAIYEMSPPNLTDDITSTTPYSGRYAELVDKYDDACLYTIGMSAAAIGVNALLLSVNGLVDRFA